MGVAEIKAVQDRGLIAMAKHYAANEQETNRRTIQTTVDERTLHEMYLLPFEMAVKDGDVASLMCAYNYVNGSASCENEYLLNTVLRDQWGFEGYVQSDFGATKSTVPTLLNGMDHMMATPQQWAPHLLQGALDAGQITVGHIDQALDRRYVQMFKYGIFDRPLVQTPIDYEAGGESAREIGTQGGVLPEQRSAPDRVRRPGHRRHRQGDAGLRSAGRLGRCPGGQGTGVGRAR
jgi:beta-glucosidase